MTGKGLGGVKRDNEGISVMYGGQNKKPETIVHIYKSCLVSLKCSRQDQHKTEEFGHIMLNNN